MKAFCGVPSAEFFDAPAMRLRSLRKRWEPVQVCTAHMWVLLSEANGIHLLRHLSAC